MVTYIILKSPKQVYIMASILGNIMFEDGLKIARQIVGD